jgi:hypothetical protein
MLNAEPAPALSEVLMTLVSAGDGVRMPAVYRLPGHPGAVGRDEEVKGT